MGRGPSSHVAFICSAPLQPSAEVQCPTLSFVPFPQAKSVHPPSPVCTSKASNIKVHCRKCPIFLLGHMSRLQGMLRASGPLQGAPDRSGGGFVQVLVCFLKPTPQVAEQLPASFQDVQAPSTGSIWVLTGINWHLGCWAMMSKGRSVYPAYWAFMSKGMYTA